MRNKKIIAFVCALSMVFSLFASFAVIAHADVIEEAMILSINQDKKDPKKATVTVKYDSEVFSDGITSADIKLVVPEGATVTPGNLISGASAVDTGMYEGAYVYGVFTTGDPLVADDNVIVTFDIALENALDDDFNIHLADTSKIKGTTGAAKVVPDTLKASTVVMQADPNATPKPTAMPKDDEYTAENVDVPAIVEVGEDGLDLEVTSNGDGKNYVVTVLYHGFADGITSADIKLVVPEGATVKPGNLISGASAVDTGMYEGAYVYGVFTTGDPLAADDNVIVTFDIALENALTTDFIGKIADTSKVKGTTGAAKVVPDDINAVTYVLAAPSAITNSPTDVDLGDLISETKAKAADDSEDEAYIAVEAKNGDKDAEYGRDYEAYYNGVKINEDTLKALIAGETTESLEDVVKGLTFKYNKGVNLAFQLVQGNTVVDSGETEEDEPDPGKDYTAKGKIASNVSKSIKSTDKKQSATFTITPAKDKNGDEVVGDTTVTINVKRTSFDAITGSGIEVAYQTLEEDDDQEMDIVTGYQYLTINDAGYEYELPESLNDKYIVSFTPAAKGTVEYVITYTDANGDKSTATAKYTVSASSTSGSGSGSSSKDDDNKSSGGGAIASGLVDSGSSYLPNLGFDDLGDVTWAQTAINTLAAKKIVSGVGDNKFDPNAALTRAAYAQMLVNAIGHSTDSADTYYDDVPTDAWFYHNVAVASQLGIVSGFGDGTFRPNDLITREQMALMTQKAAVVMGKSLVGADAGTFTDDADIADWSRDAVYQLSNAGIINGMGDGTFAPQANATRAQAAVIIYNAFVK